jgi:CRISPR-associated protein Csx10
MKGLKYTLVLEEPVLANSLAGDTNSARSLPYIPGGLMRGALVNAYVGKKEAGDKDFQCLFLNGKVRYLHAYPQLVRERVLPVPLAWKTFKHQDQKTVFDFAQEVSEQDQLKSVTQAFYCQTTEDVLLLDLQWQLNVHTQRDAVYGRARGEGQGEVYRYEALPAGTTLQGIVLVDEDVDLKAVKDLLENANVLLGKARTAGYGRAQIKDVETLEENWRENGLARPNGKVTKFTVTFLSETLLRDTHGQYSLDPLPALAGKLGGANLELVSAFRRAEVVGGFNRSWGLPLPQSLAIAAGSVFVVKCDAGIDVTSLLELEEASLGERTAEGFGRFAVSFEQSPVFEYDTTVVEPAALPEPKGLSDEEKQLGQLMLSRLLRRDLDEKMMSAALKAPHSGSVPNSQLSRWQVIIRSTLGQSSTPVEKVERMQDFYEKERKRNSAAWQKMERARVNYSQQYDPKKKEFIRDVARLAEWLNMLISDSQRVWLMLGYESSPVKKLGSQTLAAGKEVEVEYALRLMDAVLTALSKQNKEGGANG